MINWPTHLIKELADRRAIIFMGSGISASSQNHEGMRPPNWENFLKGLAERLTTEEKTITLEMISAKDFLNAAEIIVSKIPPGDIEQSVQSILVAPRFRPSSMHESIQAIDTKIVITTNYDRVYDRLCTSGDASDSYSIIRYHDSNLVNDLRTPKRIIIKAHGCTSQLSKMVLSKSSYFQAKREYRNFYAALDGLFITSTLLFLGYSMSDPDITLILENTNISAPSNNVHYCVMEEGLHVAIIEMFKKTYNIHIITFPRGRFDILEESLKALVDAVHRERLDTIE